MKVLITGGSGFLGQRLARDLLQMPATEVHSFSRRKGIVPGIMYHEGSIRSAEDVMRTVYRVQPDLVFHLAADLRRDREASLYRELMATNVTGTLHLLSAAADVSPKAFIAVGSFEEYGSAPVPFVENGPIVPGSPYGASKVASSIAVADYGKSGIIPATVLRLPVVYGEGQTQISFMTKMKEATEMGEPFLMSPGDQTRDFLHADDAVAALVRAALRIDVCSGEIINICRSEEITLLEVGKMITDITGRPDLVRFGATPHRPKEQMRYVGNNSKMRNLLGFEPQITLEEGIKRLFDK